MLTPLFCLSVVITIAVFLVIFPICSTILGFIFGPMGVVSAALSALLIARVVSVIITMVFFMPQLQKASFDAVLIDKGTPDLVHRVRIAEKRIRSEHRLVTIICCIKDRFIPFIIREAVFSVLTMVPWVGFPLVLYLRAPRKGYRTHRRYFKIMGWNRSQVKRFVRTHKSDYTGFGVAALLLEMIPGFTVVFIFTGNIGLALWTVQNHEQFCEEVGDPV